MPFRWGTGVRLVLGLSPLDTWFFKTQPFDPSLAFTYRISHADLKIWETFSCLKICIFSAGILQVCVPSLWVFWFPLT